MAHDGPESYPLIGANGHGSDGPLRGAFTSSATALLVVLLALFAVLVEYPSAAATDAQVGQYYWWYIHVTIMIFVGFGFLMTFLRSYSYSAVGLNFMASAFVILAAIICVGAAQQEIWKKKRISLDLPLLIDSNFAAGAAMISFGALLGKVGPAQILWLLVLQVPIYTVNAKIAERLGALDIGGSITIHAFGAFYGLAASKVLSKPGSGSEHAKNSAVVTSDMTAMIGTLFLFIFWPSFNGALASNPANPNSHAQFFCVVNTIIALLGACCAAFAASAGSLGKFDMVHIQNATLAGGVAVGSAANLNIAPAGALAIGIGSGCLSTLGYVYSQPFLERTIGLRDTCGVINLHGGPGIMGGVAAAIAALAKSNSAYILHSSKGSQFWYQLLALLVTVVIAAVGGAVVALLVKLARHPSVEELKVEHMYEDKVFWEEGFAEEQGELLNADH